MFNPSALTNPPSRFAAVIAAMMQSLAKAPGKSRPRSSILGNEEVPTEPEPGGELELVTEV